MDKTELNRKRELIIKGLEKAYQKMIEFKKSKKTSVVISKNGKVVEINPDEIEQTTTYKRG